LRWAGSFEHVSLIHRDGLGATADE
jgi:hypothetical protein